MENLSPLSLDIRFDLERTDLNIFEMLRKQKLVVRQKSFTL